MVPIMTNPTETIYSDPSEIEIDSEIEMLNRDNMSMSYNGMQWDQLQIQQMLYLQQQNKHNSQIKQQKHKPNSPQMWSTQGLMAPSQPAMMAFYNEQLLYKQQKQLQSMREEMAETSILLKEQQKQKLLNKIHLSSQPCTTTTSKCPSPTIPLGLHLRIDSDDGIVAPNSSPCHNIPMDKTEDLIGLRNELKRLLNFENNLINGGNKYSDESPISSSSDPTSNNVSTGSESSIQLGRDLQRLLARKSSNNSGFNSDSTTAITSDSDINVPIQEEINNVSISNEQPLIDEPSVKKGRFKVTQVFMLLHYIVCIT